MRTLAKLGATSLFLGWVVQGCSCDDGGLIDARARLVVGPEAIDFGEVLVGTERIRGLSLENRGQSTLELTRFEIEGASGEILLASPKPERLTGGQQLMLNLVYAPADVGEDLARLVIVADDAEEPRIVELRGVGVQPGAAVSHDGERCGEAEGSLSFGQVAPGNTAERTITVRASGTAAMTVLSAVAEPGTTPELSIEALPEPRRLEPGESLTLTARYAPVDGGPDRGAFVITTDAPDAPSLRIEVCGEGVAPAICARPVPLDFGAVAQGTRATATLTLESCGPEALELGAVALSSDAQHPTNPAFRIVQAPTLPRTLAPGDTVEVEIEFDAQNLGRVEGWVQADSSAFNNTRAFFPITARGAQPCDLMVAPTSVNFGVVMPGSAVQRLVLVANNGASGCSITRLAVTSGAAVFSVASPTAPVTVPGGGSINVTVEYTPMAGGGPDMGVLQIEEGGVPRDVNLIGNPDVEDGCVLDVSPSFLNYGAVPPNDMKTMGVTVTNISRDPCFIRGVELTSGTNPQFLLTSPSLAAIFPTRSRQLAVTFRPTQHGPATGGMRIRTNDTVSGDFTVPLFAVGADTGICVEPRRIDFGPTTGTATRDFRIWACGTQTVEVQALEWTTPDPEFALLAPPTLPFTLQSGADRLVTVRYTPTDAMGDTAVITVRSDDLANPAIPVTLTGGPELVPPSAGRYLYYWQIPNPIRGGDIMRFPLQGNTTTVPWWGPRTGKGCAGCHAVSPDGRYVAIIETGSFRMVDTTTDIALAIPNSLAAPSYVSWRPNINTTPPYQYAYDNGQNIAVAALFDGHLRDLQGAADPNLVELMPTWGSNGMIAFARGTMPAGGQGGGSFGFQGPVDIMLVPESGGTAVPLNGASGGGRAHYYPAFSPNGRWIAFTQSNMAGSSIAASDAVIRLAAADNSGQVVLLPNSNSAQGATSYPTWSVDGTFLSFSSNRPGGRGDWDIYLSPIDPQTGADGPAMNLTSANSPAFEHAALWSP